MCLFPQGDTQRDQRSLASWHENVLACVHVNLNDCLLYLRHVCILTWLHADLYICGNVSVYTTYMQNCSAEMPTCRNYCVGRALSRIGSPGWIGGGRAHPPVSFEFEYHSRFEGTFRGEKLHTQAFKVWYLREFRMSLKDEWSRNTRGKRLQILPKTTVFIGNVFWPGYMT